MNLKRSNFVTSGNRQSFLWDVVLRTKVDHLGWVFDWNDLGANPQELNDKSCIWRIFVMKNATIIILNLFANKGIKFESINGRIEESHDSHQICTKDSAGDMKVGDHRTVRLMRWRCKDCNWLINKRTFGLSRVRNKSWSSKVGFRRNYH